jgi:hypothetical protein
LAEALVLGIPVVALDIIGSKHDEDLHRSAELLPARRGA